MLAALVGLSKREGGCPPPRPVSRPQGLRPPCCCRGRAAHRSGTARCQQPSHQGTEPSTGTEQSWLGRTMCSRAERVSRDVGLARACPHHHDPIIPPPPFHPHHPILTILSPLSHPHNSILPSHPHHSIPLSHAHHPILTILPSHPILTIPPPSFHSHHPIPTIPSPPIPTIQSLLSYPHYPIPTQFCPHHPFLGNPSSAGTQGATLSFQTFTFLLPNLQLTQGSLRTPHFLAHSHHTW